MTHDKVLLQLQVAQYALGQINMEDMLDAEAGRHILTACKSLHRAIWRVEVMMKEGKGDASLPEVPKPEGP